MTSVNLGIKPLLTLLLALAVAASFAVAQAQPAGAQVAPQDHRQDMSVVKTASKKKAKKGQRITYTLELTNRLGTGSDAGAARVKDTLGPGQQLISATVTRQPSADGARNFRCTTSGNTVTCDSNRFGSDSVSGANTDRATIEIVAKKTAKSSKKVRNTATITATEGGTDTNLANNTDSVTVKGIKRR